MKKHVYSFNFEEKYEDGFTDQHESFAGYHGAAEEICEEWDANSAEYPDERFIWMLCEGHDTPRRFTVFAESVRQYSAKENK